MKKNNRDWLKLDNAAKIYPSTSSSRSPAQFRLSTTLKSPVKYNTLLQAWEKILKRCPYFQVYLRRGLFWYYLQHHQDIPSIALMDPLPGSIFPHKIKTAHLIKLSIRGNIIALDFSHILTDGNGGMRFLLALIFEYLKLEGNRLEKMQDIPYTDEKPDPAEFEDAHRKFFPGKISKPENLSAAYHLKGKPFTENKFRMIYGKMSLANVKTISHSYKVTTTEYFAANYLYCLKEIFKQDRDPKKSIIRLEVPVDMRRFYPSVTMRNFSLFISLEIDLKLGEYSFEEILKKVHHMMQIQIDRKELNKQVSRNVGGELNPLVRIIPLYLKDLYLARTYSKLGEKCYSGVLSNLGQIKVPEKVEDLIESFDVVILPNHIMKKGCTVFSFKDDLTINFSSVIESRELERLFLQNW